MIRLVIRTVAKIFVKINLVYNTAQNGPIDVCHGLSELNNRSAAGLANARNQDGPAHGFGQYQDVGKTNVRRAVQYDPVIATNEIFHQKLKAI